MKSDKFSKFIKPAVTGIFCCLLALCLFFPASADSSDTLSLSKPDTSAYPEISFYFWPQSAQGGFVGNLTADDIHVLENSREVKVTSLELIEPGMHIVLAVNEGKTLSNSYAGKTRIDRIKEAITTWIQSESITTLDDFSLVNNTDVIQNQLSHPADWTQALANYNPDLKTATPSLNSLSQALSLMKDLPADDYKSRAILYITPLPASTDFTNLDQEGQLAVQTNTRLYIWLIGPPAQYKTEAAAVELQKIAEESGGSFFIYSGAEQLPDLNTYLNPLTHEYQVKYKTSLQTSGSVALQVKATKDSYDVTSSKISFNLTAEAPNPIFMSPPNSITLNWKQSADKKSWLLTPDQYKVQYMIEFPDGHKRDLTDATLLVDGQTAAETKKAPFDSLTWALSGYTESGTHTLQIILQDSAGFTAKTIETPVKIIVSPKPQTPLQKFIGSINFVHVGIIAFILLLALAMYFVFTRQLRKKPLLFRWRSKIDTDPVTQPVEIEQMEDSTAPASDSPTDWPRLPGGGKAPARLISVQGGQSVRNIPVPLQDTFFGSDTLRSDVVLSDLTVAPVHSKIFTDSAKHFYIADCGTTAGTWVNYAPVSQQGTLLQHGDLVNIGAATFRFEEVNPESRSIKVLPYE